MVDNKKEIQPRPVESAQIRVEAPKPVETQPEIESWMQKIERRFARVPNKTVTPMDDKVVVQQPQSQQPPVTMPINQTQMQAGKVAKPDEGIAWLVTWVVRQIKMLTKLGRRVRLQDVPEIKN
ncbi:MAG: hypothetical protein DPW11_04255 [bacterium]|nr:hypothetical protein [Candidatus Microgenomates bacterium CPR3]MCQ3944956.1 hypothetical protein [bacterium]RIK51681.1 MAG: hypothetical protein DCC61_01915 [Candidatus Microgenomates bacterium]